MTDPSRTNQALLEEISVLEQRIQELEQSESARKQAEAALRESEERYHRIADTVTDYIFTSYIEDGKVVKTVHGPGCIAVTGYAAEEFAADPYLWFNMVVPEDCDRVKRYASRILTGKNLDPVEHRIRRKDGRVRWVQNTPVPRHDSSGALISYDGLISDITLRKRAEERLRESEEKFRTLYENAPVLIDGFDKDGRCILWNKECEKIFGWTIDEINAHDEPLALFYPDPEVRRKVIDTVTTGPGNMFREWHPLGRDGKELTALWANFQLPDGMVINIGYDITDRKQAEERLLSANNYNRNLIEVSLDPLVTISHDGKIMDVSASTERITGCPRLDLIGTDFSDYFTDHAKAREGYQQVFRDGTVRDYPLEIRHRDGHITAVLYNATLYRDESGRIRGVFAAARDISELKRADAEKAKIEEQNRQLQKTESLGRMAGAIAHHFNNQIGVVIGNLEMAMEDLPQGAGPVLSLSVAMQAARKAAEMSGLMLTYIGQSFGKREPLDLSAACRRSLPMIQAIMPRKAALETDFPSPGPVIIANANQIQQVLTNLATNGWEAIGERRGAIHLNVKTVFPADIPALHRFPVDWQPQDNAYACLEVADTGGGIEDKDIENLFDPFFSSKFTGRGMGLAVVVGIVRAHNGAVTVESEPGRGSAFRAFFPVSGEEVLRQPDKGNYGDTLPQDLPMELEGGGTVLLVEDEEMLRKMAKAMLKRLGFTVLEAKDGVEAVEVFRQHQDQIRCVLCDLTMPRMNGWETLSALRKLAPDIPVILASGYDRVQVMSGDHSEWPQVFLGKPYERKGLKDALSQALVNLQRR